jgi:CheY-like chemotaxis protein
MHVAPMKNILIIDDKEEVRSAIFAALAFAGYTVRQASNGRDGILMVLAQRPDLILCDVKMPEMDGYRTLAAIRNFPDTASIPFILMTGSMSRDEFRHAMVSGADDYLMKPFSAQELIKAVESRLTRQMHVQCEAHQRSEELPEQAFPRFSTELALAGTLTAVAA